MDELLAGFAVALTPANLMWGLAGTTLGTAVGVLPGIGPALTVALLLPAGFEGPVMVIRWLDRTERATDGNRT